jgi:hypothetical protein
MRPAITDPTLRRRLTAVEKVIASTKSEWAQAYWRKIWYELQK